MLKPKSFGDYWFKVTILELSMWGLYIVAGLLNAPQWWNIAPMVIAIGLTILVYRMTIKEGRSLHWLLLFVVTFNFGPSIDIGNRSLFLSHLIYLIPIIYAGWPAKRITNPTSAASA